MEIREEVVKRKFFIDGEYKFEVGELLDVLYALENSDGYFDAIVIYDSKMKEYLERKAISDHNTRGGDYCKSHKHLKDLIKFIGENT